MGFPSGIVNNPENPAVTSVAGKSGEVLLEKGDVGLGDVDNTADLDKPISTAAQEALDLKQDIATLTKGSVGLEHVDNTADLDKPISTATQTALNNTLTLQTAGSLVNSATVKTPIDADLLALADTQNGNILKKLTFGGLKTLISGAFKDISGGFAGLTLFKIDFKNAANTFTSYLINTNTASRDYTFPDKSGNVQVHSADYGWMDVFPTAMKDDGSGGWTYSVVAGSRSAWSASSTNTTKTLGLNHHFPHGVVSNPDEAYYHIHWENGNTNSGNIILTAYIAIGKRDGVISQEYAHTFTLTPSAHTVNTQKVTEVALNAALLPYIDVDALAFVRIVRDRSANATDTYNSTCWFHTADFHVKGDMRLTTAKDEGTGWVKV